MFGWGAYRTSFLMFYGMNLNPKCTFAVCNKMPAFYLCGKFLVGKGIITMKLERQSALWFDSDWSVVYWPIWCPCSSLYTKKSKTSVGSLLLSLAVYFSEDQLVSFKTLELLTVISVHRFFVFHLFFETETSLFLYF